jgi:hypothetical protein
MYVITYTTGGFTKNATSIIIIIIIPAAASMKVTVFWDVAPCKSR